MGEVPREPPYYAASPEASTRADWALLSQLVTRLPQVLPRIKYLKYLAENFSTMC